MFITICNFIPWFVCGQDSWSERCYSSILVFDLLVYPLLLSTIVSCSYLKTRKFITIKFIDRSTCMLQPVKHSRCGCKAYPQMFFLVPYHLNTSVILLGIYKKSEKVTVTYNYCFIPFLDKSFVKKNWSENLKRTP